MQDIENMRKACLWIANEYYPDQQEVILAAEELAPYQFLRLFITSQGMKAEGTWQTHTYVQFNDPLSSKNHFFLIPLPKNLLEKRPWIRIENNRLKIDDIDTAIRPQQIPHTTPFWYFHYDPNKEDKPFHSMTLNFSPSCLEKCVLCAGAKTGRVNNGLDNTLNPMTMIRNIFNKHPQAIEQLESVAVVTGCFANFEELKHHLTDIQQGVGQFCQPKEFRVLEHNIESTEQLEMIVDQLQYDIFVTLECFDQKIRNIALNGKVGRKGRDSKEFIIMIEKYANYLETKSYSNRNLVRVTYLVGLDSLEVMENLFQILASINARLNNTKLIPWLSIFTAYNKAMVSISAENFSLSYILKAMKLAEKYFGKEMLLQESGGTADGYARGLY